MSKTRGLFDEQIRLEKLSKKQDPLERLGSHIDFEFFRKPLEKALGKPDYSKGGRPAYDYVLLFKILILQRYYNSTGPSGSGTLVTFKIEQQDMDGKPISLVSQDVFVKDKATWLDKFFRIGSEGEREQYGIAIFGNGHSMDWSIREPKAGRGSEVLDMGEWLRLIEGTRESLTAADLAEDISKNESLVKVIQKIIQLNEAGEKTEAAADHLKKIIDGKKKDNAGNDLNFSEKSKMGIVDYGGTPVPSQSKSDVSKRKKIIIPVDSIPGLNLGPGETWTHHNEADPKKNDTMFIIKKK